MEKLHYKTLESAIKKYASVEGDIKAAIASDEKKFTPEQVEEIYQAIANDSYRYVVTKEFRDQDDFLKKYGPGEDISHFDAKRLERLVALGIAEKKSSLK